MLITAPLKIWLSDKATDMRKQIDGLCFLVVESMHLDPSSGELFIFYNRQFNKLKLLYWDKNGFCLWYKRLEKHHFKISKTKSGQIEISPTQLRWLLDGLDFLNMKESKPLKHELFF
jgi:transposase